MASRLLRGSNTAVQVHSPDATKGLAGRLCRQGHGYAGSQPSIRHRERNADQRHDRQACPSASRQLELPPARWTDSGPNGVLVGVAGSLKKGELEETVRGVLAKGGLADITTTGR